MAIFTTAITNPSQKNQAGALDALKIEEYSGIVEGTIARVSVLDGHVPMRTVRGTNVLSKYAVGEATLGKVTPGTAPEQTGQVDFSKNTVTVDTLVYARNTFGLLDVWQTQYDARKEVGTEHGKKIAKFRDQSFFIQAYKAATAANSSYSGGVSGKPAGYAGGSVVTLSASGDKTDPAKMYKAISDLYVLMEGKDVSPRAEDVMLALRPDVFYALMDAEQIVNGTYVTADGTKLDNQAIFKAFGTPVVSSNNVPNTVIASHLLSNAANGNAYDGDFTKLAALAFSPRALLAGETIPLTSDVFYDNISKLWFVDSHMSYAVTTDRNEFAGAILLP